MELAALLSSLMGLAFVSGLRLYGTVLALGLGIRTGFIRLDPAMSRLEVLGDPLVIAVAGVIYVVAFFADKIAWVDSIWDSIHTLIRPLGAAVLGAVAIGDVDPRLKLSAFLLCGSVALARPKIYRAARRGLTTAYRRLGKLAGIGRAERPVTRLL